MRCLSPISVKNPKYRKFDYQPFSVDLDGVIHDYADDSKLLVPCGTCFACLRNRRNSISFRLLQEYLNSDKAFFITLTVNDDNMPLFENNPKEVFRKWFEHLRYKTGKSPRHWIVSELGHQTHRLHFHGLIFNPQFSAEELSKLWKYGFSYVGYCNERTISYIVKYITKPQLEKEGYKPFILQSNRPGLGHSFLTPSTINQLRNAKIPVVYSGRCRISLPRYYFNKIFTEDERRKKIIDYNRSLIENPFDYLRQRLLESKTSSISEYLDKVKQHYQISLRLGTSIKNKLKNNLTLNKFSAYGFTSTDDDSSTSERVQF